MTRALFLAAILAGRFVQGETKPVERYVIAPVCIAIVAAIFGGYL
jgi:hypothetical protein